MILSTPIPPFKSKRSILKKKLPGYLKIPSLAIISWSESYMIKWYPSTLLAHSYTMDKKKLCSQYQVSIKLCLKLAPRHKKISYILPKQRTYPLRGKAWYARSPFAYMDKCLYCLAALKPRSSVTCITAGKAWIEPLEFNKPYKAMM